MHNSKIYGGFKGDGPYDYDLSLRDFEAHPSILDGDHRQGVIKVLPYLNSDEVVIDGFTIQNGVSDEGGGILLASHTTVNNCKISHNSAAQQGGELSASPNSVDIHVSNCEFFGNESKNGGAIRDYGNTTFQRCDIHDNVASLNGGGIHNIASTSPSHFINCAISHNSALNGGGAHCSQSRTSYWSCLIINNTATNGGGCYGEANFFNCTIVKNEGSENYGGIYNTQSTSHEIKNCIIWGNVSQGEFVQIGPVLSHTDCAVQDDATTELSNINLASENDGESPGCFVRFINADVAAGREGRNGDWRLQSNSLCIDRADSLAQQPATDLEGNPRLRHKKVDLGAYESNTVSHVIDLDFCETAPYYYEGLYIPQPGTYTFLYPGNTYDSLVILNLTTETIFLEEEICETDTYDFFGEILTEPGHYSTNINCMTCYYFDLTVKPIPTLQCSNDTLITAGNPAILMASGADSYLWSTGDTTARIVVFPEKSQIYYVTGYLDNGCSATKNIKVKVEKENANDDILLFPNPANDKVNLYKKDINEVLVFNVLGEQIDHISAHREGVTMDVSHYDDGVYIVKVRVLSHEYFTKLIVQH